MFDTHRTLMYGAVMKFTPSTSDRERQKRFRMLCIELGITAASIARELGVSQPAVSGCVAGRIRSKKIESEIVRLFPELIHLYPFGGHLPTKVARRRKDVNCAGEQEVRSPTKRRSPPVRRGNKKSA